MAFTFRNAIHPFLLVTWAAVSSAAEETPGLADPSNAEVRFIPATPENTTLEGGVALERVADRPEHSHQFSRGSHPPAVKDHWHWWETAGGGVFATTGAEGSDAPILRTLITGLRPNSIYQVDGFFRAEAGKEAPQTVRGDIRMGLTIARTEAFGPKSRQGMACLIGVDHPSKRVARWQPQNSSATAKPLPADHPEFALFRASLGVARSDVQGTLVVFIDDQPNDTLSAATLYEGVAVSPAPDGSEPAAGSGSTQVLVEAVRVGDRETMERELAAEADLNKPDREGFTALFYACLAGDHDLVTRFLKAGAKHDAANQRLTPLWAVARNGEAELVNTLLDAGAEIPTACLGSSQLGGFMDWKGPIEINPVSAALLSGSVETLEALLKRQPDLDLGKAVFGPGYEFKEPDGTPASENDLISLSMSYLNFDMVRWLIQRGHSLDLRESSSLPFIRRETFQHGARSIMIRAIMRESPLMDIVDALVARGVPLIVPEDALSDPVIGPWDALSAAAFEGHADWVRRWLPLAKDAESNYQIRLLTVAEAGACPDCVRLVREAFPNIPRPGYRWTKEHILAERERLAGDTGGFVPRPAAPAARPSTGDTLRLVVIGYGAAAGPADALAALASADPAIVVIDRQELAAALAERSLAAANPLTPGQLNDLGDSLKTDLVITATSFGEKADTVLRLEAHDVRSGLTRHRMFQLAKDFAPDAFASAFLADLRTKMNASRSENHLTAITLLSVTAEPGHFHGSTLAAILHTGLLQEIDATPGLIALTRDQLAPLAAERALGRVGGLWGAAWTIEGGLRASEQQGNVILTLRLRPVSDEKNAHDITVDGPATAPRKLVLRAWAELLRHIDDSPVLAAEDDERAAGESDRLAREAQWLLKTPLAWQAAPLSDAALYLGGDRLERLMLRQKCHWAGCHVINPRRQWADGRGHPWNATGQPLAPHIHLFYLYWLDEHLELLRLTSATLDEALVLLRGKPHHQQLPVLRALWEDLIRLTEFRCRLVPQNMNPADKATLVEFDRELQVLWKNIAIQAPIYLTSNRDYSLANRLLEAQRMTMNFRQLPWLGDLLARELLTAARETAFPTRERWAFGLATEVDKLEKWIYPRSASLAQTLENSLDANDFLSSLRHPEITWLRSHGPARIHAAKSVVAAWSETLASRLHPPSLILDPLEFAKWQASHGFGLNMFESSPFAMPLPSLVAAPRHCVDMEYRTRNYHRARQHLALATAGGGDWQNAAKSITDSFKTEIPKLAERKSPANDFDLLIAAARETDDLFGTRVTSSIEPTVRNVRPEDAPIDSFGITGGFRVATRDDALQGGLLADLGIDLPGKNSFIISHAVDPRDRNLLWLISQPVPDDVFEIHESIRSPSQWERFTIQQPWLLCVDCRDGTVVRRVNLIQAAFGRDAPAQSPMHRIGGSLESHITFSDDAMLVLVSWRFDDSVRSRALVLDRKDGTVIHSHPYLSVLDSDLTARIGSNIVGLGRDFYLLMRDQRHVNHYQLWKLSPDGKLTKLNTPGRRPVESPFDAEDRNPKLLRVNAGKILVASAWEFGADYDPLTGQWNEHRNMNRDALIRHVGRLDQTAYHATLYPQHILPLAGGCGGRFAPPKDSEPGTLVYYKHANQPLRVSVNLPVNSKNTSTFRISPMPVGRVSDMKSHLRLHPPESVSISDLVRSDMVRPTILNQTDEHLIVGLYLEIQAAHGFCHWSYEHLPYLWKISKSAAIEHLLRSMNEQ